MCAGAAAGTRAPASRESVAGQAGDRPGAAHLPAQVLPGCAGAPLLASGRSMLLRKAVFSLASQARSRSQSAGCHVTHLPTVCPSLLQTNPPYKTSNPNSATLPMALLTAIVRKEAQLPPLTAAFAAAQLLPVIQDAMEAYLETTDGQHASLKVCKEMLVRRPSSGHLLAAAGTALPWRWDMQPCLIQLQERVLLVHGVRAVPSDMSPCR